jgi:predicted nucleic acid-binding protein
MGRITQRLAQVSKIAIDTAIFIYHLEAHPSYHLLTREIFSGIEQGRWQGISSTITLMEINVKPIQLGRLEVARQYEALLVNFPNLSIFDITRDVARIAARIRADFRVRSPDALQVATALIHGAEIFITNDQQLSRLQTIIDVIILDDFT